MISCFTSAVFSRPSRDLGVGRPSETGLQRLVYPRVGPAAGRSVIEPEARWKRAAVGRDRRVVCVGARQPALEGPAYEPAAAGKARQRA